MKYRIRMNPIAPYDAPGMERWLEGLARQGYFPWEVGTALCFLERGEPRELRYRLAPNGGRRSPGADLRRALYRAGSISAALRASRSSPQRIPRRRSPTPTARARRRPWRGLTAPCGGPTASPWDCCWRWRR